MENNTLIKIGKDILKTYLGHCNSEEILMFRKMYSPDDLKKHIEDVVDELDPSKIDHGITQCENTLKKNNSPYIVDIDGINVTTNYNPNYGDDRECVCGHPYYRHFDPYEKNNAVGCKYCDCFGFEETTDDKREDLRIKDLLIPRYEVINHYPKSHYNVGQIIEVDWEPNDFELYPHLYKKLEWYEKRNEVEMPKYLKDCLTNEVFKVKDWVFDLTAFSTEEKPYTKIYIKHPYSSTVWLPVTKKEYLDYKKENNV